jgi:hypothetical protein
VNPRRPGRSQGQRDSGGSGGEDSPAQTNLGLLLQRALQQAQQTSTQPGVEQEDVIEAVEDRETKLCANCWNALTFKEPDGRTMARCGKDLWIRPAFTLDDLNAHRVRRWYADCPEYDDSE